MNGMPQPADSTPPPVTGEAFLALLEQRRSTRMFREQPVPPELLERLIYAATLMPTSCNRQLWHFVAITDPAVKAKTSRLSDAQQSYLYDAPVLLAVFYDTSFETRNPCSTAQVTAGITIATLLLAAETLGLGAIYLGGIRKPDGIRKAVGAPPWLKNYGLVCIGYRDDAPPAPNHRPVADVLDYNRFTLAHNRYHADIRPHLWKLSQLADFRDKLLWYKGVHIDAKTLHVDSDVRASPKFQFMLGRLGMMIGACDQPRVLDVLSFNGDVVFQLLNSCDGQLHKIYAYDLTPGIARYIDERFRRLRPAAVVEPLVNAAADSVRIPLPDQHVQVLSCYERLEHFADPLPLLREMHRVLAPGGKALVVVSNRYYPHLYRYRRMRHKDYALGRNWNRGPERKYEPAQIERHFRAAGFRVTTLTGLQPVHLKLVTVIEKFLRRAGCHRLADRAADWRQQRYATTSLWRHFSSSLAYELSKD